MRKRTLSSLEERFFRWMVQSRKMTDVAISRILEIPRSTVKDIRERLGLEANFKKGRPPKK